MIRLFTTIYPEKNEQRRSEYERCLQLNAECPSIDEICLLSEGGEELLPESGKFTVRRVPCQPTYSQFFDWISEIASDNDISVIANTDIYFDNQLAFFLKWQLPERTVFALSRWDWNANKKPVLYDHADSQDTWIIRGTPSEITGNIAIGRPRCDNRIAAEMELAGYKVINPSFSLSSYHIHDCPPRPYLEAGHSKEIPPPYKYVWPQNLFGPFGTLAHNLTHRDCPLHWRFDLRKFKQLLPIRALSKVMRILRSTLQIQI